MSDPQDIENNAPQPEFKPMTTRLILWQIAKELHSVASELAHIKTMLKQISQKMK